MHLRLSQLRRRRASRSFPESAPATKSDALPFAEVLLVVLGVRGRLVHFREVDTRWNEGFARSATF